MAAAREAFGLLVVTEAIDHESLALVDQYADMIQIGARNMQNFALLKQAGRAAKPVLLKRGMSATLDELLMAAEYIMSEGNYNVVLCERGIRTFAAHTRNTLDVGIIPAAKKLTHLPIIVDPSHAAGERDKVVPLARAGIAAGADGLIVEVHCDPDHALSDGAQSLYPDQFAAMVCQLRSIGQVLGRTLHARRSLSPGAGVSQVSGKMSATRPPARPSRSSAASPSPAAWSPSIKRSRPICSLRSRPTCASPRAARARFLLESVEGGEHLARYSFLGAEPAMVVRSRHGVTTVEDASGTRQEPGTAVDVLRREFAHRKLAAAENTAPMAGGCVGYLGYAASSWFDPAMQAVSGTGDDACFLIFRTVLAFDHARQQIQIRTLAEVAPGASEIRAPAIVRRRSGQPIARSCASSAPPSNCR